MSSERSVKDLSGPYKRKLAESVGFEPTVRFYLFYFHLVNNLSLRLYPTCTLRFEKKDRVLRPSAAHIGLRLLLALPNPWCIVLLCNFDTGVA
jgi:hypothetical protein